MSSAFENYYRDIFFLDWNPQDSAPQPSSQFKHSCVKAPGAWEVLGTVNALRHLLATGRTTSHKTRVSGASTPFSMLTYTWRKLLYVSYWPSVKGFSRPQCSYPFTRIIRDSIVWPCSPPGRMRMIFYHWNVKLRIPMNASQCRQAGSEHAHAVGKWRWATLPPRTAALRC